jgi:hypothetical protein
MLHHQPIGAVTDGGQGVPATEPPEREEGIGGKILA